MFGGDIRIGRLAGIPISVHPLWLVIVALITWSLGASYYPDQVDGILPVAAYGLGLASALLLFGSIVLHELGHAVVARRYGIEIDGIELWLLGGVAKMSGTPHRPQEELRFAIAGPAVTAVIGAAFLLALVAAGGSAPDALTALLAYEALINGMILAFNLMPAFPLDGGRVLRAALWQRRGSIESATAGAARVGRGFGYGLIGLGVFGVFAGAPGLLWFALIGFFVIAAGRAEETGVAMHATFAGLGLRRVTAVPAVVIDSSTTVPEALGDFFSTLGYHAFPVVEGGRPIGLITMEQLAAVPAGRRAQTLVGSVADRDPSLFVDEDIEVDDLMARRGFQRHQRAIMLCRNGQVGLISATAMARALRAHGMLDEEASAAPDANDPHVGSVPHG